MSRAWSARCEWLAVAFVTAAYVVLRMPLYGTEALLLGWNSDSALFGLMARAMAEGRDVPVFFWGQFYLGTLTSMITVAVSRVLDLPIAPLALRIAAAAEVAIGIAFFWSALRRLFGRTAAAISAFWLAAGPAFLFHFTIAPLAGHFFLWSAVIFWYVVRTPLERPGAWFTFGLLSGFGMWLHQGVMFLVAAVAVIELLRQRRRILAGVSAAVAGAAVGYLPAAISLMRDDVLLYRRTVLEWNLVRVWERIRDTAAADAWDLVADTSPAGLVAATAIYALFALGVRDVRRDADSNLAASSETGRGRLYALVTIAFSAAFYIGSAYPFRGAMRYIVPVVPMLYGFAAAALVRRYKAGRRPTRVAAVIIALFVSAVLYAGRAHDAMEVATGRSEQYLDWPGGFDPRPVLRELRTGGFRVCYGEVWVAHKLEWLSEPTVRFVPIRSVHRTLPQSLQLIDEETPKCLVTNDGDLRLLLADEEAALRAETILRARKAGLR